MAIVEILLWVLGAGLAVISVYMLCLIYGSWRYVSPACAVTTLPRTVFIVPAHDEEHQIGVTVSTLLATRYPADRRAVLVVADNCTDDTADMARAAGAQVVERFDPVQRGKGQALDWCLKEAADWLSSFDLIGFVDADMQVDPHFLRPVSEAFADESVEAVQGQYTMSSENVSWLRAAAFASFAYVNHIRPAGRCYWGGTAGLKGGGMVFRRELILRTGWPAGSIIEDIEFGLELLTQGIRVTYVPEARVTSTVPVRIREVAVQQSRWEGGKRAVYRRLVPSLVRQWCQRPSWAVTDALLDSLVPPLSVVVAVSMAGLIASVLWAPSAAVAFAMALVVFGSAVLSGLLQLRPPRAVWMGLVLAPAFMIWKLLLLGRLLIRPAGGQWRRTPRSRN